ncbi:MAG: 4-hydroxybutyrate CoA-transferase [Treponema sp.]|jgi:4-hydroxybutyrate CoA-transferase|nr:4-hydroxybutyrate CoA-transferase [Treponema sp.]
MGWNDEYKKKLCSAKDAVSRIKSGDRVVLGHAAGEPSLLADAMVENAARYQDVEIVHMVAMGKGRYCLPEYEKNFRHNSIFVGACTRKAIEEGRGDFTPIYFSEVPKLFRTTLHPNVLLAQLSPPDEHGYCSFGISNDYTKPAAECADIVIAQINRNMPRTFGDCFIHVSDLDYIVEADMPVIELAPPEITSVEKAIGENCASLIHDGDTLQLGIGAIPDAVLLFLKDKHDLGIHSEMISDGVVTLAEAGVINNKKKVLNNGKFVISFMMGTRKLYDFVDNNPSICMMPIDYVNDPVVIAQNVNIVSINSCVQVDLMGQVCSESIGLRQISAVGGQVDFVRGANMAKNGRTIIAMPSTAAGGKVSKIVSFLDAGATVTTSRCDVNYVVTEYGIAQLKGQTLRERARRLIEIAHPDFHDSLKAEFEKRFKRPF